MLNVKEFAGTPNKGQHTAQHRVTLLYFNINIKTKTVNSKCRFHQSGNIHYLNRRELTRY